jgi:hypothetical protein
MKSHEQFKHQLTAAPQDVSLPVFEELKSQGYDKATWHTSPGATDGPCIAKNDDSWSLEEFLLGPTGAGLQHAAPVYERTHVGCHCSVVVSGPGLPDVIVTAFGKQ